MQMKETVAVIGGDLRQARAAELLALDGMEVCTVGLEEDIKLPRVVKRLHSVEEAIKNSYYVLLPMPLTQDGFTVNAPFSTKTIALSEVFGAAKPNQILFAGLVKPAEADRAKMMRLRLIDYLGREELAVFNAIPTAEGALQIAMEELPVTIYGLECLVVGFGRIGKVLADRLRGLGAKVTVAARKWSDAAWIKTYGYQFIHMSGVAEICPHMQAIFNTAPALVMDETILSLVNEQCLIIDLASKPGGVDFEMASKLGIHTVWALSLPGKVAPFTAGEIIKETIINIIEEESV